jgi:hypothetical protein
MYIILDLPSIEISCQSGSDLTRLMLFEDLIVDSIEPPVLETLVISDNRVHNWYVFDSYLEVDIEVEIDELDSYLEVEIDIELLVQPDL